MTPNLLIEILEIILVNETIGVFSHTRSAEVADANGETEGQCRADKGDNYNSFCTPVTFLQPMHLDAGCVESCEGSCIVC